MGDQEIDSDALVQLLSPEAKLRIVAAVLEEGAGGEIFNPSAIYEHDGVSRDAWYRYHEDLEDAGLIMQDGRVGNSPVYRLANDQLAENIRDVATVVGQQSGGSSDN